jgi:ABC-type multidrug transport system fused ATPase/permease subunit
MNIVYQLFEKYFYENKLSFAVIVSFSLIINFLQTKVIAQTTATIFDAIEKNKISVVFDYMYYFMGITVLYLGINIFNEYYEIETMSKLIQWMRREFLNFIILSNNEDYVNIDTIKYNSPINRISFGAFIFLNQFITNILPNLSFILIVTGYFLYTNIPLGLTFLIANMLVLLYGYMTQESILKYKIEYEMTINETESYTLDILNNFDKIISRGQAKNEMDEYSNQSEYCIHSIINFFKKMHENTSVMTFFIYIIILGSLYYLVTLKRDNKLTTKTFISLFTIMLMYRDRFSSLLATIPTYIDMNGRIEYATDKLKDLKHDNFYDNTLQYEPTILTFSRIDFQGVYYKYKTSDKYLFENLNLTIVPSNNIVGITGLSGRGKSTIMKLLLRLYPLEKGTITIDGKDIHAIDPIYIRQNITYINQSAKLFNKRIIENIMYGCNSEDECKKYLEMILSYPKIKQLYANVDLINGASGSLGENLSGGQRQIINIISGLINPSPILVLDEPTNALDAELKSELLAIIDKFRSYKKCIIIITHDRDVYPLFDTRIKL